MITLFSLMDELSKVKVWGIQQFHPQIAKHAPTLQNQFFSSLQSVMIAASRFLHAW